MLSFVSVQRGGGGGGGEVTVKLLLSGERQTSGVEHKETRLISSEPPGKVVFDVSGSFLN